MGRVLPVAGLVLWLAAASFAAAAAAGADVLVFAAASTAPAVGELGEAFRRLHAVPVRISGASTATLARQIEQGAPADVFLSANREWMDYLVERHLVDASQVRILLRNRLVLAAPRGRVPALKIAPGFPLAAALGSGRLVMGDPQNVPVGVYARQALEHLGVWEAVKGRIAPMQDASATLAFLARGEGAAGIVYRSDLALAREVAEIDAFPADSHDPIDYPAAPVRASRNAGSAALFLAFLAGAEAREVFLRYGFEAGEGGR